MAPPRYEIKGRGQKIQSSTSSTLRSKSSMEERRLQLDRPSRPSDPVLANPSTPSLETLPVEVINSILSYLTYPKSRLPGLTEHQSSHTFPKNSRLDLADAQPKTSAPDTSRPFADLFAWTEMRHPFNVLAATSRHSRALVESYSAHLVKTSNRFKLPFAQLEAHGSRCVYPDMSRIVYRRLWLQMATRYCVFCGTGLSVYPHSPRFRVMLTCESCFLAQILTLYEIQEQYHISDASTLAANNIRCSDDGEWYLRTDVEALALQLYGTRAFHGIRPYAEQEPCEICHRAGYADGKAKPVLRRSARLPSHVRRSSRSRYRR